jgi:hypothetical protein
MLDKPQIWEKIHLEVGWATGMAVTFFKGELFKIEVCIPRKG